MIGLVAVVAEELAPENIDQVTSEARAIPYYGKKMGNSGGYNMGKNYGRPGYAARRNYRSIEDQETSEGTSSTYYGRNPKAGYKMVKNYGRGEYIKTRQYRSLVDQEASEGGNRAYKTGYSGKYNTGKSYSRSG